MAALPTLRIVSLTLVSRLLLFLGQKERWKKLGTSSFLLSKLNTLFWIGILTVWLSGICATKTKKDFIIIRKKRTMDTITFRYIYMPLHSSLSSFQCLIHALISHTHTHTVAENANCLPISSFSFFVTHRILISFGDAMCSLKHTVSDGRSSSIFIFLSIWTVMAGAAIM